MKKPLEEGGSVVIRISVELYKAILQNTKRDDFGRSLESVSEVLERLLGEKK